MITRLTNGRGWRATATLTLLVAGGALAAATWAAGDHGFAIALLGFYLATGVLAYFWAGRDGDLAAALRAGGDERQRGIDRDANAFMGTATSAAAVVGAIVSTARHQSPGDFGIMCVVGGVAYVIGLAMAKLRS